MGKYEKPPLEAAFVLLHLFEILGAVTRSFETFQFILLQNSNILRAIFFFHNEKTPLNLPRQQSEPDHADTNGH